MSNPNTMIGEEEKFLKVMEIHNDEDYQERYMKAANRMLISACIGGNIERCKVAIKHGANIRAATILGIPLNTAIKYGHTEIIRLLKEAGAE
jgi:hypothetical protein